METTPDDRRDEETDERHPHEKTAAELSDRAAESVGERYDGTKEAYEHTRAERDEDDED